MEKNKIISYEIIHLPKEQWKDTIYNFSDRL